MVIQGCFQKDGVDNEETFALVVKYTTLRMLIVMTVLFDWDITQMDAVTVYLIGDIEEIYMQQPKLYEKQGNNNFVCILNKALYGLKQAGRSWYAKLDGMLHGIGLVSAAFDCCVYYHIKKGKVLIITVYVDDLLIFSSNVAMKAWLQLELTKQFKMKDLGTVHHILGICVIRDRKKGTIRLDKSHYIEGLLKTWHMHACKPLVRNIVLSKLMEPKMEAEREEMR